MAISKAWKPDNFESHNSLKLSFTNIRILLILNLSLNQTLRLKLVFPAQVCLCETNLDDSIDSGSFSARGDFPLMRKDITTHMHGLAVYTKERLPFAQDLPLENSTDSYLSFKLALIHPMSFSCIDQILRLYARFLILFHLT